MRQNPIFKGLA